MIQFRWYKQTLYSISHSGQSSFGEMQNGMEDRELLQGEEQGREK